MLRDYKEVSACIIVTHWSHSLKTNTASRVKDGKFIPHFTATCCTSYEALKTKLPESDPKIRKNENQNHMLRPRALILLTVVTRALRNLC